MTLAAARILILSADMVAIRAAHAKLSDKSGAALAARDAAEASEDWDAMDRAIKAMKRHDAAETALYCAIAAADRLANRDFWMR
jgi:hypothetical protein